MVDVILVLTDQCQSDATVDQADCFEELRTRLQDADALGISNKTLKRPHEVLDEFEKNKVQ